MILVGYEMDNTQVSIIVPVYNIVELLPACVDSLVNQTYKNTEIILVDDGSTDGSSDLCDKYEKEYDNIVCVHQVNRGLSSARNTGIKTSTGKYVLFVDSDDYIKLETCEVFVALAEKYNCDMVAGDEIKLTGTRETDGFTRGIDINRVYDGREFLLKSLKTKHLSMCAPYSMYRRTLITDNEIFFKEGILHEDELWTPQITLKAQRLVYSGYRFYYHRYREGSITHSKIKTKNSKDLISTCYELYDLYSKLDEEFRNFLMDYLCMLYLSAVYIGIDKTANRKFALKTARSIKNRMKAILFAISPGFYFSTNRLSGLLKDIVRRSKRKCAMVRK